MFQGLMLTLVPWFAAEPADEAVATYAQELAQEIGLETWPADWPPPPDFHHEVDYLQWWRDQRRVDPEDNAAPLWKAITYPNDGTAEERAANDRLWGRIDDDGGTPGLFLDYDNEFEKYAWDPKDHPRWEKAYQLQMKHGLYDRLHEIAEKPRYFGKIRPFSPDSTVPGGSEVDWGFTGEEPILIHYPLDSLATNRKAVRILLSNAWRAPKGTVNPAAMRESFRMALKLAQQVERGSEALRARVGIACRQSLYDSLVTAMEEDVLPPMDLLALQVWMREADGQPMAMLESQGLDMAYFYSVLQYAYSDEVRKQPELASNRIEKLAKCIRAQSGLFPTLYDAPPPDLEEILMDYDAVESVRAWTRWQSRLRRATLNDSPQEVQRLHYDYEEVWRKDILVEFSTFEKSRLYELLIQMETERRATQCILAIHCYQDKWGRWPLKLEQIDDFLPRALRIDPFSGKPFLYESKKEKFRLYSVGWDGEDQSGKHHKRWGYEFDQQLKVSRFIESDYVFWPIPTEE